jgi:hypothetical protein
MRRPRLHKSSIVVGLIVALLLVLIETPGRVVSGYGGTSSLKVFEHGWPWIHLRRESYDRAPPEFVKSSDGRWLALMYSPVWNPLDIRTDLPRWGIPWLSADNWRFWESYPQDDPPRWTLHIVNLVCNLAVALVVLSSTVAVWEIRQRRRSEPVSFRFGLRGLLLATAAAGAVLGWLNHLAHEHRRESALIDRVDSRTGPMDATWYDVDHVCVAPLWLRSLVGVRVFPEFFWRASAVNIQPERGDKMELMCAEIAQLDHVTKIGIEGHLRHYVRFSALRTLAQMKTLEVWRPTILDEQDLNGLAQLKQLQKIVIEGLDEVDPEALARLKSALPDCKVIDSLDDW